MNILVKNWPFYSLSNSLIITISSKVRENQQQEKINGDNDESGSLQWMMIEVGDISLYPFYLLIILIFAN